MSTTEDRAAFIQALVAQAPPLTSSQLSKLSTLFGSEIGSENDGHELRSTA
jgi:hypothetical protein